MNFQNFVAISCALPMALSLQPLAADPSFVAPTVPEIDVQQPAGNSRVDDDTKVSFGTTVIGKIGKPKKFTIRNIGNGKLTGLTVTRDGVNAKEFKVIQAATMSLAPGTSTTFTVTFNPTGKGTRSAAIHIKNNDSDEASFDMILTGNGQLP